MPTRRNFLTTAAATTGALMFPRAAVSAGESSRLAPAPVPAAAEADPWLEIHAGALAHNTRALARLTGRPLLAVAKNNAYGLGLADAGPLLDRLPDVWGLAVVRADEAFALRDAGVRKPVLLMGPASERHLADLVARDVAVGVFAEDAAERLARVAERAGRAVPVHLYLDTGMHRLGYPVARALGWIESLRGRRGLRIEGAFTELTEDADFDRVQVGRLRAVAETARDKGVDIGRLHAASSDAIMRPNDATFLDVVRPGLAVYGGYPTDEAMERSELQPAYSLKARVMRVHHLAPGEGVSYHRRWTADRPSWVATLPVGHVDGYPSGAVRGAEVLIGGRLYPVIGTVSASHTIVAVGEQPTVNPGDEATLVGGAHPAVHPNTVAKRSGWSEYNMFMHLNPLLARRIA